MPLALGTHSRFRLADESRLDLDCKYGGLLLRDDYIFISELAAVEGLCKYEPDPVALLNGLLADRLAA
jgi:hypothetical protein